MCRVGVQAQPMRAGVKAQRFMTGAGILLYRAAAGETDPMQAVSALLPGAALLLLAAGTKKAGCADGIVLMAIGALEGDRGCLAVCFGSLVLIALLSGVLLALKRVRRMIFCTEKKKCLFYGGGGADFAVGYECAASCDLSCYFSV